MKHKETSASLDAALIEALAVATPPEAPSDAAAARIREKLFQRVHAAPDFLFVHSHQGEWVTLLSGVELKLLRQDGGQRSYLMRMAPGARLPAHKHAHDEESLVLEGDVTINGVLCHAGDYHFAPRGKPHSRLTTESGCLLFVRGAAS